MKIINYLLLFISVQIFSQQVQDTTNGVLWEYMEWQIPNVNYSGNPFDVIATVSFIHTGSNKVITTEMFYDGNNTWKFRFTGTRLGIWKYFSFSKTEKLNGIKGTVKISANGNKRATGFLVNSGNKFVIQTSPDSVKGFLFNVYMNGTNENYSFRNGTKQDFINYAEEAKRNGCTVIFSSIVANSWFNFPTLKTTEGKKKNPDPRTFEKLEKMISAAREKNVSVHIWSWGDEENKLTQKYVSEGINGKEDKRLQRYIAARLGPLPGWSMGYGFDLHEWVNENQVKEWADYLQSKMDYPHFFSARGQKIENKFVLNAYDGFGRDKVILATTEFGPHSFNEVLEDLTQDTTKPHFYEERHSYNRKDTPSGGTASHWQLDMDGTRRLMWWEAIAGGLGGWFGFYSEASKAYDGYPYPNPEQLETHRIFWSDKKRFLPDMIADSNSSGTYMLFSESYGNTVLYKENSDIVEFNFNRISRKLPVIAVDTKLQYKEIRIDTSLFSKKQWNAPYKSDWAMAIGNFNKTAFKLPEEKYEKGSVELTTFRSGYTDTTVDLNWETVNEKNIEGFGVETSQENDSTDWQIINFIPAQKKGAGKYSYTDLIKPGKEKIYYRLKIYFTDMSVVYSNIITVKKVVPNLVNYLEFKVYKIKSGIKLQWKTSSESNVEKFVVERLRDTSGVWKKITEVKSKGNSGNINVYEYTDTARTVALSSSYRIKTVFNDGSFESTNVFNYTLGSVKFELKQNYPNPFNPFTTIQYSIPAVVATHESPLQESPRNVTLKIFDILGREIATLVNRQQKPGIYEIGFDGTNLPSGLYFYRIQVDKTFATKKMILLK